MIAYRGREVKRGRKSQMARNIERLYKEAKCRDCSVIVTRMDFAKILGKFTKVKIQYENVSSPKTKKVTSQVDLPSNDISRLKTNENGMVLIRRNAYNKHPINNSQLVNKKSRVSESSTIRSANNVLKENNGNKQAAVLKDKNSNVNPKLINSNTKQYTVIFFDPINNNNKDGLRNILLAELVPKIDKSILPSEDWYIDYLPKSVLSKDDKVYDRIEAELEGLMFNEKPEEKSQKLKSDDTKVDDFPSIMDILNDNYSVVESKQNDQNVIIEFKNNLESSDVEAMLLGKPNEIVKISESNSMEVDSTVMSKLIEDVENISAVASVDKTNESEQIVELSIKENRHSPSILDDTLEKGIEGHLPAISLQTKTLYDTNNTLDTQNNQDCVNDQSVKATIETKMDVDPLNSLVDAPSDTKANDFHALDPDVISHVIFKKITNGICTKTVTCPKNLNYKIEFEEKSVEFLGAPKYITSIEDLQVLLQIVNESGLDSLYVLH